ncbi:MAG: hypothetical protein ICV66_07065, partial [Chitinophagaceae bacterium]|nr:hypothetical protein [Chitinophagaceae bacterium]
MKINEAERWLWDQLKNIYDEYESAAIASMVLEHITGFGRVDRITRKDEPLNV